MNNSKLANTLGSVGVLGGIVYSMKKNKGFGATAFYVIAFGVAGILIGNSVTKFYE
jgi:xanthosine utilization system XapX-like protein